MCVSIVTGLRENYITVGKKKVHRAVTKGKLLQKGSTVWCGNFTGESCFFGGWKLTSTPKANTNIKSQYAD